MGDISTEHQVENPALSVVICFHSIEKNEKGR